MERYLARDLRDLLSKKLILLTGPRQVGKTTLARSLSGQSAYYNYDVLNDRKVFRDEAWDRSTPLVVFDELHKMRKWKLWLKNLVDQGATKKQQFLVTGSARLDIAKKMGDSLAGRFFSLRLHPLDLKELRGKDSIENIYRRLISLSGFPEPYLEGNEKFYNLWSQTHIDVILRQDLVTLEAVRDLDGIENLTQLLRESVGSTVSHNSLARTLDRSDKTISRWLELLEEMYVVFRVPPYSKNVVRGIKKAGKYYFFDCAQVGGGEERKIENLVAQSLKKEIEHLEDTQGIRGSLHFVQNKEKQEIDFVVSRRSVPTHLIEVKLSDAGPSPNFSRFEKAFPKAKKLQWVRNLEREYLSKDGVHVVSALNALANLDLLQ